MPNDGVTEILLGDHLDDRLDDGLDILHQRNPGLTFDRHQLIRVAVGYGLERIFRQHDRKAARLPGWYNKIYPFSAEEAMIVENLSQGGAGFRTTGENAVRVNEVLRVRFVLDDSHNLIIQRSVLVKYVNGRYVGVLFCEPDPKLIAYLKKHSGKA